MTNDKEVIDGIWLIIFCIIIAPYVYAFTSGIIIGFRKERERKKLIKQKSMEAVVNYRKEIALLDDEIEGINYQLKLLEMVDCKLSAIDRDSSEKEIKKALQVERSMQSLRIKQKKLQMKRDRL